MKVALQQTFCVTLLMLGPLIADEITIIITHYIHMKKASKSDNFDH